MPREPDIASADGLWAAGKRPEALNLLKTYVRAHPSDDAARISLVRRYRELNAPDQAGRWGLAIEGLITEKERDRAVRLLAASGVADEDVATFLALPSGDSNTITAPLLPLIAQRRQRVVDRPDHHTDGGSGVLGFVLVTTSIVVSLIAANVVWLVAYLGAPVTQLARWFLQPTTLLAGLTALYFGIVQPRSRHQAVKVLLITLGAFSIAAVAVVVSIAGVKYGWEITFTWEH